MHKSIYIARPRPGGTPLQRYLQYLDASHAAYGGQLTTLSKSAQLIVGFRSQSNHPDRWDDTFAVPCSYWGSADDVLSSGTDPGDVIYTQVTTDPGAYWLGGRMGSGRGTAILTHRTLHRDAWVQGHHKGDPDRPALVQHGGKVVVWRDTDRDGSMDDVADLVELDRELGYFGINFHSTRGARTPPERVGPWSAGCQVLRHPEALDDLLSRTNATRPISYLLVPLSDYRDWYAATHVTDPALVWLGVS